MKTQWLMFGTATIALSATSLPASGQTSPPASNPAQASPAPAAVPDPAAKSGGEGSDIVVTGSRITRRDYVAESPLVTIGAESVAKTGSSTIESALNELPQVTSSAGAASNSVARGGQANVDLRGLGQQRTLVLLDGRRIQPSNPDGTVDLNIIPPALIKNVEVITGGASSTYGSDAIAGVVNIISRKDFKGLEFSAITGITERSDGGNQSLSLTGGTRFADDRGSAYLSVGYSHRDAVEYTARDFLSGVALSQNLPSSLVNVVGTNLPSQAVVNSVFTQYGVAAGAVSRSAVLSANRDGTLFTQVGAINYRGPTTSPARLYNGNIYNSAGDFQYAQIPLTRYNALGSASFKLSDRVELYVDGLYTHYTATSRVQPVVPGSQTSKAMPVPVTNPFIPADLARILASRPNPTADFTIVNAAVGLGARGERDTYDVYQVTAGARGSSAFADLTWDVYGSIGRTSLSARQYNSASADAFIALVRAPDGGRSLCAGGYNPFADGSISPECRAYVGRSATSDTVLEQRIAEADVQGRIATLPGGDLKFALGADYRQNKYSFRPDPLISNGDLVNYLPIAASSGSQHVAEVYGELLVPIVKDLPFVREFSLDLGYRYSDYQLIGGVSTYKADASWKVTDAFGFRGGYARATRAPSVGELYAASSRGTQGLGAPGLVGSGDPCDVKGAYRATGSATATQVRALCVTQGVPTQIVDTFVNQQGITPFVTSGNLGLRPESTDTFSVGAVFHPRSASSLLSGLNASVDFYSIKLNRAIGLVTNTVATSQCFDATANPAFASDNFYCQLIRRNTASGQIIEIANPLLNLGGYSTTGIDFAVDYGLKLEDLGASPALGRLTLSVVGTYLRDFKIRTLPTGPSRDYAGTIGNRQIDVFADAHPTWKVTSSFGWQVGAVTAAAKWRFIDAMGNANNVGTGGTAHGVPSVNYFDLDAKVTVSNNFDLRAGVTNLTDRAPPILFDNVVGVAPVDLYTYDLIGRRFYVAVTARF